jgi:predicted nucleotidyltransferase
MNVLENLLQHAAALLDKRMQPWALIGGLAVSVRTEPRFTRDLDLAVAVASDAAAESLIHEMQAYGYVPVATVEQEQTCRLATVRMIPASLQSEGLLLDILFASSGIEAEICRDAEILHISRHLAVPVASVPHLIVLKILARDDRTRPQDALDLRQLISGADADDMALALDAARLIEARGYNRGRDLVSGLQVTWAEFRDDRG